MYKMKLLLVCLSVILLDVFRVCQTLKCTPVTANTCRKSKYVTGVCKSGVCECVPGMVPDDYGCHKPFKPDLLVEHPPSFNGQMLPSTLNYAIMQCDPRTFDEGSYRWYRNGTEVMGQNISSWDIRNLRESVEIQCAISAYDSALTEKSDPYVLEIIKKDQPFTKKPIVSGMPRSAFIDSTIRLSCGDKKPRDITSFQWHVNGDVIPDVSSSFLSLKLSAARFDKSVTCTFVDDRGDEFAVTSDPVLTPSSPVDDIPNVVIKGNNRLGKGFILKLVCEINEVFGMSPTDVITYAWKGPDGNVISGATSKNFSISKTTVSDAGSYLCEASYNGQPVKTSPEFIVTFDTIDPVLEAVPKKPVVGGYIALICTLPGYDPSAVEFTWESYIGITRYTLPHLTDNILQMNDIEDAYARFFTCSTNPGFGTPFINVYSAPISDSIKPVLAEVNDTSIARSYVFSCNSDYETPGIIFEWYIDDVKQADTNSKKFRTEAKFTPTKIACRISFNSDASSFSNIFSIPANGSIAPPVIEVEGQPLSFFAGASYVFVCSSISHHENATYSWKKGDSSLGINTRNLTLSNIQSANDGDYTCTITIGGESEQSRKALKVVVTALIQPVIEVVENTTTFIVGGTYSLICSSPSHQRDATYGWKRGNTDLNISDRNFTLSNIQSANDGDYTCTITIGGESEQSRKALKVVVTALIQPVIEVVENTTTFIVGGTYGLICSSPSHQRDATYGWKRGNTDLNISDRNFTLSNIQSANDGDYTCTITIGGESEQSRKALKVVVTALIQPVIEVVENTTTFIVGGTYGLICSSPSHQRDATYGWKRGNTDLNISDRNFTISNVQKTNSGSYICTITLQNRSEHSKGLEIAVSVASRASTHYMTASFLLFVSAFIMTSF